MLAAQMYILRFWPAAGEGRSVIIEFDHDELTLLETEISRLLHQAEKDMPIVGSGFSLRHDIKMAATRH